MRFWFAQMGDKHPSAKPLKGFKGAGVLEIVEDHAGGNILRGIYGPFRQGYLCSSCVPEKK